MMNIDEIIKLIEYIREKDDEESIIKINDLEEYIDYILSEKYDKLKIYLDYRLDMIERMIND